MEYLTFILIPTHSVCIYVCIYCIKCF